VLLTWIEEGVIALHRDDKGYLFDWVDESRVALACDLHYRMGLDHASLPVILSLIDQLHDAPHHLRALTRVVAESSRTQYSGRSCAGSHASRLAAEPENVRCKSLAPVVYSTSSKNVLKFHTRFVLCYHRVSSSPCLREARVRRRLPLLAGETSASPAGTAARHYRCGSDIRWRRPGRCADRNRRHGW
jgi:hypothetical protein